MFPLAHNYMTNRLLTAARPPFDGQFSEQERRLMLVGSVLPDFVTRMGMDRDFWHSAGAEFYHFAEAQMPKAIPLALGVWLHGIDGCGFDTYADEVWQGKMGWCFLKCLPYIPDAVLACNLPRKFALWKAHNLVEMTAELEIAARYPQTGRVLLASLHNEDIMQTVFAAFGAFAGGEPKKIRPVLETMEQRFSITATTAEDCAAKYLYQLKFRHEITGGSVAELAALLERIRADLKDEMWAWFDEAEALIAAEFHRRFPE